MPAVPVVAVVVFVGEGVVTVVGPEAGAGIAALAGPDEVVAGVEAALTAVAVVAVWVVDETAVVVLGVVEELAQTVEPVVTQAESVVELVEVVGALDAFVAFAASDAAFARFGGLDAPFYFPLFQASMCVL